MAESRFKRIAQEGASANGIRRSKVTLQDARGANRNGRLVDGRTAQLTRDASSMQARSTRAPQGMNLGGSIQSGMVVQCVGGPKFGLENTGDAGNPAVAPGIAGLQAAQVAYKAATKATKDAAIAAFRGGDMADRVRQRVYTDALRAAEMTPEGLVAQAGAGFTLAGDVISHAGVEIARIRRGDAAYVLHAPAQGVGYSAVYKRHTLAGPSAKEYVRANGEYLRRTAHRGITPLERRQYVNGQALTPINAGHLATGQTGYSFDPATGVPAPRAHDAEHPNDLEWLNAKAGAHLGAIPNNPSLVAFLQTRKGVGKALSATSTEKDITSNHGAAFTGFGNIDIDLARVPTANILHHYKQPGFSRAGIRAAIGAGALGGADELVPQTARANESVTRNREIVLSAIPHASVTALHESPARTAYEARLRALYDPQFLAGYNAAIAASPHTLAAVPAPAPAAYPYRADHFTAAQAEVDFNHAAQVAARAAGAAAAAPRLDFANAYVIAYGQAWRHAYEDAAWNTQYVEDHAETIEEINVPATPAIAPIPPGLTSAAGTAAGGPAGSAAGAIAGATYAG